MNKKYLISKTSKVEQTSEDEFNAEFNSPECMWDNFLSVEIWSLLEFIKQNYKPLGDYWIRNSNGLITDNRSIMNDYAEAMKKT